MGDWLGMGSHALARKAFFPRARISTPFRRTIPFSSFTFPANVAVVNSAALKLAGITAKTPNPVGGEVEHDSTGEPDGMLKEGSAISLSR